MTSKRTIPQIRLRLHELAAEHGIPELSELAEETKREFGERRTVARRAGLTPERSAAIRQYAAKHPTMAYHDIADAFKVGIGRVSEALRGKRGER